MNGTQQRAHTKVTTILANDLTAVAEGTVQRFITVERRIESTEKLLRQKISDETTHRLKLADEQRTYVDREIGVEATFRRENDNLQVMRLDALEAIRGRGFWGRVNWLITGR
jgi:hypothetical protein